MGNAFEFELSSFLGPKWHLPIGSMPFHRAQKLSISRAQPPPTCPGNGCCPHQKHYARGRINHRCINSYFIYQMPFLEASVATCPVLMGRARGRERSRRWRDGRERQRREGRQRQTRRASTMPLAKSRSLPPVPRQFIVVFRIRIESGFRIRIRIQEGKNYP